MIPTKLLLTIAIIALVSMASILAVRYQQGTNDSVLIDSIDQNIQDSCGACYKENYGITFGNPIEAFYWLEVNSQTDPEFIIMKYDIAEKCGYNCTITDPEQEMAMIRKVYRGDGL